MVSLEVFPERINYIGRINPKCWWHHPMECNSGLNTIKEKWCSKEPHHSYLHFSEYGMTICLKLDCIAFLPWWTEPFLKLGTKVLSFFSKLFSVTCSVTVVGSIKHRPRNLIAFGVILICGAEVIELLPKQYPCSANFFLYIGSFIINHQ